MRKKILAAFDATDDAIDAIECARRTGEPTYRVKQALSSMLAADLVYVTRAEPCFGGKRFFYRAGPKPFRSEEAGTVHEHLRAMQIALPSAADDPVNRFYGSKRRRS